MTLHDVAENLRALKNELIAKGRYDPARDCIAARSGNRQPHFLMPDQFHNLIYQIYDALTECRKAGAFDAPHLIALKRCLGPSPESIAIPNFLDELEIQGFDCWGVTPGKGAIERMADALERIGKSKTRRRIHNRQQRRRVTPKQAEAVQFYGDTEGNIAAAARKMGVTRATFTQHLKAGMKNAGVTAGMFKLKTTRFGNVFATDDDEGQGVPTMGPRSKSPTKRR